MLKVAILGCGPAGMFVAHALRQLGDEFDIYSKHRRSEMFGAQYLHSPINGLSRNPPINVKYMLEGSAEGYRGKVYAYEQSRVESVSPEGLTGEHPAWDIREAYYEAYRRYSRHIIGIEGIDAGWVKAILKSGTYDAVVSTIPAPSICSEEHQFHSVEILAAGDAPERGIFLPRCFDCPPDTVLCNGDPDELWYRQSNVFAQRTVEWPIGASEQRSPSNPNRRIINDYGIETEAAVVKKPISHECDCFAGQPLIRMGRYGKWQKGELAHHVYFDTIRLFAFDKLEGQI